MKKQMSLFVWAVALFGMAPVWAATNTGVRAASSADLSSAPAVRARDNVNYKKYQTRSTTKTYKSTDRGNMYYAQPTRRSDLYKQYDSANSESTKTTTKTTVRTTRAETLRSEMKRKYYLAHPFFQPMQGKFGSVTDLSYTMNSYDFTLTQNVPSPVYGLPLNGLNGKWDMKQFSVKEDFSYGITDRIAVVGMLQFDSSDYKFKWDNADADKMDDSGLNMFGIGAQWRFVDNDKWIATLSGYLQHQKDVANTFVLDLKGGYKIARSTIYGLARGWYVDFDGNAYGNAISSYDATMFIAYDVDTSHAVYFEAGIGAFSVLDEDWTLNLEAVFGNYDWHNQASIKGAIGWQPNDWIALNLYAKTSFYDSANDKHLDLYWMEPGAGFDYLQNIGSAKLDKYSETNVGLQATLYF